ncbi:hypothetical protein [Bacillus chungangensis]|uniref:Uncharacterized protein n=1 Tax=Bacillus chungangensis TaxID=587633 RepID=A0ABT9WWW6_9BACI|nr:hypothetical protein [Bacillus chungangensis]MDQ0177773.1 hypothetical protein [Bacillus chungangensis]
MSEKLLQLIVEKLNHIETDLCSIKDEQQLMKADIQSIKDEQQLMKAEIQTMKEDIQTMKEDIQTMKEDIRRLEAKLDSVTTQVGHNTEETVKINYIADKVNEHDLDIKMLKKMVAM